MPIVYKESESPKDTVKYRECKERLARASTTASIPWVIRVGSKLVQNQNLVDAQIDFLSRDALLYPHRVHKLYGLYKAIVYEVTVYLFVCPSESAYKENENSLA